MTKVQHQTVLLEPAIEALVTDSSGFYVDGTFGRGGHSRRILQVLGDSGRLLAIDRDPDAVSVARKAFADDARFEVKQGAFSELASIVDGLGKTGQINGVLLDLGVSSPQLDEAQRGFSFTQDGPLDMRMNPQEGDSAAQWLASASEKQIADVLYHYGEERHSRRIARALVAARKEAPIATTLQLAELVKAANPSWEKHKHPATRAFQAIRIHVNRELEELQSCLSQSIDVLGRGGRLVVISFHSLEDRIVKQFMRQQEQRDDLPRGLPLRDADITSRMRRVGKAIKPDASEVAENPRARSAVMRIAERL